MLPYWENHEPPEKTEEEKRLRRLECDIEALLEEYLEETGKLPVSIDALLCHEVINGEEGRSVMVMAQDEKELKALAKRKRALEQTYAEDIYRQREAETTHTQTTHARMIDGQVVETDENGVPLEDENGDYITVDTPET